MKRTKETILNIFLAALIAVSVVGVLPLETLAAGSYDYKTPVTIDSTKVSSTLTNFPVVISSTLSQLATVANGGHVQNTDTAGGASGSVEVPADFIVASDSFCSTQLDHEVENYDKTTGQIVLHVKVPSLSGSTDTTLYLCYGDFSVSTSQENISGVWANGYEVVYHLGETSGTFYDSTGGHNGSDSVSATGKTGKIGNGQEFDNVDDRITASAPLAAETSYTYSAWFQDTTGSGEDFIITQGDHHYDVPRTMLLDNQFFAGRNSTDNMQASAPSPNLNTWYYNAGVRNGSNLYMYRDGSLANSDSGTTGDTIDDGLYVGANQELNGFFGGYLDEVRVSSVVRSADWIATEYNNQSNPETFYSVGAEIAPDTTPPTLDTTSPADGAASVSADADLVLTFSEAVDAETGYITIYKSSDDSVVEALDVAGAQVTGGGTATITADPSSNLDYSTSYYVQVDGTAFDDGAGNSYAGISDTTSWDFTTQAAPDTTPPTLNSTTPADGVSNVPADADLVLTFSEAVDAESGYITIYKSSDDSVVEALDVAGAQVTGSGTATITADPSSNLDYSTSYYVQVDGTAFDDGAGNSYAGISDTTSWDFTVAAVPPVAFGTHSVTVSTAIETALENALNNYRPDQSLENPANMWVVTDISDTENADYDYVSLAGLLVDNPSAPDNWSLYDSVWTGLSILRDNGDGTYTAGVEGSTTYDNLIDDANVDDPAYQSSGGSGSYSYYFPWVAGTLGYYGTKGVHGAGPSDPSWGGVGWRAVDWVGGTVGYADNVFPNGAYVSQSGKVSYVCRDEVQTWVQIGNFLYGHLVDNSNLRMNQYHSQGSFLGSLVTGSHLTPGTASLCDGPVDARCGYMCQRDTSYHLHFGFKTTGDYFQMEDWVLNLNTGNWVRGSDTVGPGGYLKAEWSDNPEYPDTPTPGPSPTPGGPTPTPYAPDVPTGGGGGSIWDGFIGAAQRSVTKRVSDMSQHEERRIVQLTTSGVRIAVSTVYVLLRSNLDLTITMIVFGLIMILEPVRVIRSVWMGIKDLIPFVG